jgi:hypothetical protein
LPAHFLVDEVFVIRDGAVGVEDGVEGEEEEGEGEAEGGEVADGGAVCEVVVVLADDVEPDQLSDAQHAGREPHQLPHHLIENCAAGGGTAGAGEEGVLLRPVHEEEADEGEDDDAGVYEDVEAGEVEDVNVVDVRHSQLELREFIYLVQLLLTQRQFLF